MAVTSPIPQPPTSTLTSTPTQKDDYIDYRDSEDIKKKLGGGMSYNSKPSDKTTDPTSKPVPVSGGGSSKKPTKSQTSTTQPEKVFSAEQVYADTHSFETKETIKPVTQGKNIIGYTDTARKQSVLVPAGKTITRDSISQANRLRSAGIAQSSPLEKLPQTNADQSRYTGGSGRISRTNFLSRGAMLYGRLENKAEQSSGVKRQALSLVVSTVSFAKGVPQGFVSAFNPMTYWEIGKLATAPIRGEYYPEIGRELREKPVSFIPGTAGQMIGFGKGYNIVKKPVVSAYKSYRSSVFNKQIQAFEAKYTSDLKWNPEYQVRSNTPTSDIVRMRTAMDPVRAEIIARDLGGTTQKGFRVTKSSIQTQLVPKELTIRSLASETAPLKPAPGRIVAIDKTPLLSPKDPIIIGRGEKMLVTTPEAFTTVYRNGPPAINEYLGKYTELPRIPEYAVITKKPIPTTQKTLFNQGTGRPEFRVQGRFAKTLDFNEFKTRNLEETGEIPTTNSGSFFSRPFMGKRAQLSSVYAPETKPLTRFTSRFNSEPKLEIERDVSVESYYKPARSPFTIGLPSFETDTYSGSRLNQTPISRSIPSQILSNPELTTQRLNTESTPVVSERLSFETLSIPKQKLELFSIQKQATEQEYRLPVINVFPEIPLLPEITAREKPPKYTPVKPITPFFFIKGNDKRSKKKSSSNSGDVAFTTRYLPSVAAIGLNIRGRQSSAAKVSTGYSIRPIAF